MVGAAIGSVAVGATSLVQGGRQSREADKTMGDSVSAVEGNVDIAKQLNQYLMQVGAEGQDNAQRMMDDWEANFGGIEEGLSEYYNNLDPTKFATQNKAKLQESMDKSMKQMNEGFATSGIQTGGMKMQAQKEAAFEQAKGNAAIDIAAPEQVNQMKQGFLNTGANQKTQANSAMTNAINNKGNMANMGSSAMMGANRDISQAYAGWGGQQQDSATGLMGAGGTMMGAGLGGLFGGNPSTTPDPIQGPVRQDGTL